MELAATVPTSSFPAGRPLRYSLPTASLKLCPARRYRALPRIMPCQLCPSACERESTRLLFFSARLCSSGFRCFFSQFEALVEPFQPLQQFPNVNDLWAFLIIEECCRLGITYFCIAPGSRSSALAVAAAQNSHASCISCIDERSLAFHALGYARGAHKPAAVITSSGTAISNLLPAVVEASQDCIPLLLLTADRPPELLDTGANQTINQVNHFGSFVRYFYNLPPPDDKVPARMVLTTIDTAVFRATEEPSGPAHINCAFREPLAGICCEWSLNCLKGLDRWMSKSEPFTKYMQGIQLQYSENLMDIHDRYHEVVDLIQGASRGLLIVGGLKTAEETWAALLLGRHLGWPIIPDILSGLRLRKFASTIAEGEMNVCIIDFLDHVLLSSSVKHWMSPDVVLQVGSRLTSKRIAQLLEDCRPDTYIMVASHPYRHDPSHILTHRIQDSIAGFASAIRNLHVPKKMNSWNKWLKVLNDMVGWEISFQLNAEPLLTEPYVSRVVYQSLSPDSAIFLGNSMAIRDADMYGLGWSKLPTNFAHGMWDPSLPFLGLRVAGNRGASGIDGVLSTAIGYAAGSNRRDTFFPPLCYYTSDFERISTQ